MNKLVEKAVTAARLYMGAYGLPIKTQQRFYDRMMRECEKIAKKTGGDLTFISEQVDARARSLGAIAPMPGKDY